MEEFKQHYKGLIDESLTCQDKVELIKKCEKYTDEVIRKDVLPEDIVDIHKNYILTLNLTREDVFKTLDVLQEIVKGFGYSYRDYQRLVDKLQVHDKEIDLASSLQQTMLKTDIPQFDSIQIGVISVAAQKVSGDYFNLIDHNDGTMFYGLYEEMNHLLYCSSAGHEPGYIYRAEKEEFEEISVRGRVLGISSQTRYQQQEIPIYLDDLIIILTDGVTEARNSEGTFIDKQKLLEYIKKHKHMHPQDIVQIIYEAILKLQNPNKKDDMTILIIKRVN
ncbi:SpoIIE family protein phosphatase [Staphylococcus aureus]|uniref:SpoIIE family protein phosphatase n=1 Tax=Staphylococcus aureus TaxID=1280 RepID=UPI0007C51894|nr:PP2C family protein-serine/threonine phosphatase [Staphylococcus aureus]